MTTMKARNAYRQTEQMGNIHPVKLVYLMYERAVAHLDLAMEGVREKKPIKRGEHLGKVIALITELNASIKTEDDSEAADFLRGLYTAILMELPKVAVNNDITILEQSRKYIRELMQIWEQTAMREHGFSGGESASLSQEAGAGKIETGINGLGRGEKSDNSGLRGLSVSI